MPNNINSTSNQTNNIIPAEKLSKNAESRLVYTPSSLHKFSLSRELRTQDEFRQGILYEMYAEQQKQKNKKLIPILKYALATAFVLLITKPRNK